MVKKSEKKSKEKDVAASAPVAKKSKVVKKSKKVPEVTVAEPVSVPVTDTTEKAADAPEKKVKRKRPRKSKQQKCVRLMEQVITPKVDAVEIESAEDIDFNSFALDERILKCIGQLGWSRPTQVQESVIPLALEDKNIMARARTGSGKTAAFLLPIIHKVLSHQLASTDCHEPLALFVAPTKELASQIFQLLQKLISALPFLQCRNLSDFHDTEAEELDTADAVFVVATPSKLIEYLNTKPDYCKKIRHVVLDEADLLLSFGYQDEMTKIRNSLPAFYQCIFTSATLNDDMSFLKKLFMPGTVVTVKLKEGELPDADQLNQYHLTVGNDDERFAILVAMFKLRLIAGKTVVFVNSTNRGYQLSLVLRAFGVKTVILNSSMPANSRCHVIEQFNNAIVNVIIASDTDAALAADTSEGADGGKRDKESGVARGIDFIHVSNVINFDFPTTVDTYVHRVGRTARGWNKGTALSFCSPEEMPTFESIRDQIHEKMGQEVLKAYEIRIKELDTFVLRTREALGKCTKGVIKQARLKEIKQELLRSEKLQGYFAKNAREKDLINTSCHPISLKMYSPAIADVPEYMVPMALRGLDFSVKPRKRVKWGKKQRDKMKKMSVNQRKHANKKIDPLKSFSV